MAQAGHEQQVYEDFKGGEYGDLASRYAAPNQFHAKNMVVYRDGAIGPRAGLRKVVLSGDEYVNGALNAFHLGLANDVTVIRMYYIQSDTPRNFEASTTSTQNPGTFTPFGGSGVATFDADPGRDPAVLQRLGYLTFYAILGDKLYYIDALTDEMHPVADSPGGRAIVEYLDQIYVAGTGNIATANRVQYSDHADPDTWPVENFFDIGYAWPIFAAYKVNNGVVFIDQNSRWWLLQGTPEAGSLRSIVHGRGPNISFGGRGTALDRDRVWFIASEGDRAFPAVFDGAALDTDSFQQLRWLSGSERVGALVLDGDDDLLFVGGSTHRGLWRHHGIWTFHEYDIDVSEYLAERNGTNFFLTVDGDETHKPSFYRSQTELTRPGFASDTWGGVGDDSDEPFDAFLEFPEINQPDGTEIRPMSVLVEFTSYDTGASVTVDNTPVPVPNHFEVSVRQIDAFRRDGGSETAPVAWDETVVATSDPDAFTPSTTSGVRRRFICRPEGTATSPGLQVRITNIRGVKFERIVIDYEVSSGASLPRT